MQKNLFFFLLLFESLSFAEISLTFGGDVNLNPSRGDIDAKGATKHGTFYTWEQMLSGLAPLIDGDLNFANIETTINDMPLKNTGGKFVFSTHPDGLAYAVGLGFNLLSLSNNHIGNFGLGGIEATIDWLEHTEKIAGPIYHSGLARTRAEALQPKLVPITTPKGTYHIAFLAMTAVSNKSAQATDTRAGTLYFRDENDFNDAMNALKNIKADYKIFSVHGGTEGKITLDEGQQKRYNQVLELGDVDLILGHHPHRVRPIEKVGHRLIFYSLGNYQMLGAANIESSPSSSDFGLMGKLFLEWDTARQRLVAQAAQLIALTEMHVIAKPLTGKVGIERMELLNKLNQSELGNTALPITVLQNGFGASCLGSLLGSKAKEICAKN